MNNGSPITDELLKEYATRASDHLRWYDSARSLFSTAKLLEPKIFSIWDEIDVLLEKRKSLEGFPWEVIQHQSVYMMLCAFSIENLLKGQIVEQDRKSVYDSVLQSGKLPKRLTTHNLLQLADDCHVTLTDLGKKMLHFLTRHSTWIGRYPLGASTAKHFYLVKPEVNSPEAGFSGDQMTIVKDLVNSISSHCHVQMDQKVGRHAPRSSPPTS